MNKPTSIPTMKKKSIKKLRDELWILCKNITRERYVLPNGMWKCYTCDHTINEPSKAQTAHFIPSGSCGTFLRYDLRNLRICCYHCNINLGGNGAEYYRRIVKEVGQEAVDQLFRDKNKIIKADVIWYTQKIEEYEQLLNSSN